MGVPYLAELRLMSFNFAPKGWAFCNGQLLPINQNQALFALLGTTYGGDGRVNFALPDLRSRVAMHFGDGFTQGERAGQESHALTISELPQHTHLVSASNAAGDAADPKILAQFSEGYSGVANPTTLHPATIANTGGSQSHTNLQPHLALNWCIALQGIFPSRN
jgi:microcystin-dependent protein